MVMLMKDVPASLSDLMDHRTDSGNQFSIQKPDFLRILALIINFCLFNKCLRCQRHPLYAGLLMRSPRWGASPSDLTV